MKTLLCKSKRASSFVAVLAGASLAVGIFGCGGSSKGKVSVKSGLGEGNKVQPPPKVGEGSKQAPARNLTADAQKDFKAAVAFYNEKAKEGWTKPNCQAAADRFAGVAADHPKLVEARYDAGLSYHQCGMKKDAEREYQKALQIHSSHAPSISNLGEIYFDSGKVDAAKKYWERAIQADPKLIAARNNLAWLLIEEMRKMDSKSAGWKRMESDAKQHLSSVLAVDNENVKAYVLYGLLYMEGSERNENRLDLAKLLLDEAKKRDAKYAPLYNALGLYYMRRDALGLALESFQQAVALDPNFIEARRNVGSITLGFRKYDEAAAQFSKVLELSPKCYDSHIGLGIAQRGLGNLDKAEEYYNAAKKIGPGRAAAYFNLGVLYKDFLANKASDLRGNQAAYRKAKGYFEQFLTKADASRGDKKEAQDNIKDCDKIIDQLEKVIQQQAKDAAGGQT